MKWMYDIYQKLPGGGRLWIESATTLEHAKERLISLCVGQSLRGSIELIVQDDAQE